MNSIEDENESTVKRLLNTMTSRDFDTMETLIHQDYEMIVGSESIQQNQNQLFPDFKVMGSKEGFVYRVKNALLADIDISITQLISKGDEVWVWALISGIHNRNLFGLPPTNAQLNYQIVYRMVLKEGKLYRAALLRDSFTRLKQLGQVILEENENEKVSKYMNHLRILGLIN
ncbi:MAG: ester cyclase [Candidatus Kariarchaeaceae archaeon]|jgi:hypothetical protein